MRTLLLITSLLVLLSACSSSDDRVEGTSDEARIRSNAIFVSNQKPDQAVMVTSVAVEKPAFVVIYMNNDREEAEILGTSALLPVGYNSEIRVPLTRKTTDKEELLAIVHTDNGDSVFNVLKDEQLEVDGSIIGMPFTIEAEATVVPDTTL